MGFVFRGGQNESGEEGNSFVPGRFLGKIGGSLIILSAVK